MELKPNPVNVESYGPGLAAHSMPCPIYWAPQNANALDEYEKGQWWTRELESLIDDRFGKHNLEPDQQRAICVVRRLMNDLEASRSTQGRVDVRPAVLDVSSGIFHPSRHAQEQGWRLLEIRGPRRWLFNIVKRFIFTDRSTAFYE